MLQQIENAPMPGILSRYPFEDVELYRLETGDEEGRVLSGVTIRADGIPFRVYNTHLSFESTELRTGQIFFINNILKGKGPCMPLGKALSSDGLRPHHVDGRSYRGKSGGVAWL